MGYSIWCLYIPTPIDEQFAWGGGGSQITFVQVVVFYYTGYLEGLYCNTRLV